MKDTVRTMWIPTRVDYGTLTEAIKTYIKNHPGCSQTDIRLAMDVTPNAIAKELARQIEAKQIYRVKQDHFYRYSISPTTVFKERKSVRKPVQHLEEVELYEIPTVTQVRINSAAVLERLAQGPVIVRAHDMSKWLYEAVKKGKRISRKQRDALVGGVKTKVWTVQLKDQI